jgi:aspartokinase
MEKVWLKDVEAYHGARAKTISKIDVEKLANLCDFGAKFIHRKALKFMDGSFKVRITSYKNSKLNEGGTIIQTTVPKPEDYISAENPLLACLTIVPEKSLDVWRIVPKVFRAAEKNKIQILMFLADADSLTLYVYDADAERAAKVLHSKLIADGRINCLFALAVKRGIKWTKLLGVEIENFHKEMEALKNSREKLFGVLTAASNFLFFTASGV